MKAVSDCDYMLGVQSKEVDNDCNFHSPDNREISTRPRCPAPTSEKTVSSALLHAADLPLALVLSSPQTHPYALYLHPF